MSPADIGQVVGVDRDSYPVPWPASAYRRELNNNQHAQYIVLREVTSDSLDPVQEVPKRNWLSLLPWPRQAPSEDSASMGRIVGYAGMWIVADEAHITTIAVRSAYRGTGFGELMLASLIGMALDLDVRWVTLEVRISNIVALNLYRKYGFRKAGMRKNYYSDNNEDALIMTTEDITLNAYRSHFEDLLKELDRRLNSASDACTTAPVLSTG